MLKILYLIIVLGLLYIKVSCKKIALYIYHEYLCAMWYFYREKLYFYKAINNFWMFINRG